MVSATQTFRGRATLEPGSAPIITNLVSPGTASTEFSHTFAANTKKILIRCRGRATTQFSFTATESGTKYITIRPSTVYTENNILFNGTIYLQVDKASQTIEILEWS